MDFTQFFLLGMVIAGVTELIARLRAKDYWVAVTILSAAIIGGIFGFYHVQGLPDVFWGIATGLGTSGFLKTVSMFTQKSTPTPSDPVTKA